MIKVTLLAYSKQIIIKSEGQKDYLIQEESIIYSLKCVSSTYDVITASLDGTRKIQIAQEK